MSSSSAWTRLKQRGSAHYKTGKVEPIDLYKAIKPHPDMSALDVKALTDIMKYSYRQFQKGINKSDLDKIAHYLEMLQVCLAEKEDHK